MTYTFHKIKSVKPLSDFKLKIHFIEGNTKIYDIKPWFEQFPVFLELKNNSELFTKVQVAPGGYGIIWNDNIDISCEDLYFDGIEIK